jgi:AmmeMemoRadiSam system protein B
MHLPYIAKVLGKEVKIVPIMVGPIDEQQTDKYAKIFTPYFDDNSTVFIISTDFCHWGPQFKYKYQKA